MVRTLSLLQREFRWLGKVLAFAGDFMNTEGQLFEDFFFDLLPIDFPYQYAQTSYTNTLEQVHAHTQSYFEDALGDSLSPRDIYFAQLAEQIILLLSLAPHLTPELFEGFRIKDAYGREVLQFGGVKLTKNFKGFLPTGHTAQFLLAGQNLTRRFIVQKILAQAHYFSQKGVLSLGKVSYGEPPLAGQLILSEQYLHLLTTGKPFQPQYSVDFPATLLTTDKTWDDLILRESLQKKVFTVKQWVTHYNEVKAILGNKVMKGFRLMMYGSSGTGKTLTAMLLAKHAQKPLYRININQIVDKYVGETNKKLEQVFRQASNKDWILFFDEGDSLFGKRSEGGGSSNERYANQEVNYLLTKMEEYEGMIFLSTNKDEAIDDAFKRRFESRLWFREPDDETRILLWKHFFTKGGLELSPGILLREIATHHDYRVYNAAWIEKFHRFCVLQTVAKGDQYIALEEMLEYLGQFKTG
ncbi:ATP-binding protein [uncultured Microscilla sp.]|uniref:ATP-binding protein n=1 Tax=uncultured Microscilla sp. TaxID=432653 RepID=UPI002617BA56|nr:ATP-binding protein [uncultured Microscilla sp.]